MLSIHPKPRWRVKTEGLTHQVEVLDSKKIPVISLKLTYSLFLFFPEKNKVMKMENL